MSYLIPREELRWLLQEVVTLVESIPAEQRDQLNIRFHLPDELKGMLYMIQDGVGITP